MEDNASESVYEIQRGQDQVICFRLREYKEKTYLDIRVFFKPEDSQEIHPTKKGITVGIDLMPEFKKGVFAVEKKLQSLKQPAGYKR
jgi:hypothetical protein